ncbi:hypothetical protein SAPIO_CDS4069 [Scedosporium apiospermum]|uniref:Nephrocystin 3-like N-terminal domain-containing protein n=1 Tax=Pseudallescheria apiosperma TaxID=563466 RepID=A0A084G982_PSEDA|nr:uncharacterized protein SAPIO_CDS4069 [Scedosporium apiospermum]KEZ43894.1 hypothetical protein SAPIO_CDS4069 [Scedosporium apiospermum]
MARSGIAQQSPAKAPRLSDGQKKALLNSLRFGQIDARQMSIKAAHHKTCEWLLKQSEYLDWLDIRRLPDHHGFLWIKGKPGAGKSTLMKFALANSRRFMRDTTVISFFFNARGTTLEKSTIGMYRSLLLQILEQLPKLQDVFESVGFANWNISSGHSWSIESLKDLFQQTVQSLGQGVVTCFIDALDECDEDQIRDMVAFFQHLGAISVPAGIRFQVCFSSRHYPHITISQGLSLVLEGQEGHNQDITDYVDSELKIGQTALARKIKDDLREKSSGVFMWVVLVVGMLNKEHDAGQPARRLQQKLNMIPGDLHELFRDILTRDGSRNREDLLLCIQWVLFAREPLTPEQLYFAILSGTEPEDMLAWDPDETTMDTVKRFILNSSKGLAEVTTFIIPTVQFIHESVRDFLLKENGLDEVWSDLGKNFAGQSHDRLKQCCFRYINVYVEACLDIGDPLPRAFSTADASHSELGLPALIDIYGNVKNGFVVENEHYGTPIFAALAHGNHLAVARILEGLAGTDKHLSSLCTQWKFDPRELSAFRNFTFAQRRPVLSYLAEKGAEILLAFALAMDQVDADVKDESGRTPLSWAASSGHGHIVKVLLATGQVDADSKDNNGRTPLSWTCSSSNRHITKVLLATGLVNANSKDNNGQTPFSWAARRGHEAAIKALLSTGQVDVNSKDNNGQVPLSWAAKHGHEATVKVLLAISQVDADSKDNNGRTPLSWAASHGREATVKVLLATDQVDADSKDNNGRTPLSWAASSGHGHIVKVLLATGQVDANSKDNNGRVPLSWAAKHGHKAAVNVLLATGQVDANLKG